MKIQVRERYVERITWMNSLMRQKSGCKSGSLALIQGTITLLVLLAAISPAFGQNAGNESYFELSLEELMDIQVTSASRYPQPLLESPNAVWVISAEDIRHSGARHIAEAVGLAPGVYVSRFEGERWVVTIGGFTPESAGGFTKLRDGSNRLLVLIDGMAVFSSMFGNIEWDSLPVSLNEIQRIEVIRGSGGLIYGANAIDGVIHIFTRRPEDANSDYLSVSNGTQGIRSSVAGMEVISEGKRFGARLSADYSENNGLGRDDGDEHLDYTRLLTTSLNTRYDLSSKYTLLFDHRFKSGEVGFPGSPPFIQPSHREPQHRLTRLHLERNGGNGNLSSLQFYKRKRSVEEETSGVGESYKVDETLDLEFRHVMDLRSARGHVVSLGGGVRRANIEHILVLDGEQDFSVSNFYINDEWDFGDRWSLHSGLKWEKIDLTVETWPWRVALNYRLAEGHVLRAGIAKAYRSPTLLELFQDTVVPSPPAPPSVVVKGNPDLEPERASIQELEYRGTLGDRFLVNILLTRKIYEDVISNYQSDFGSPEIYDYINGDRVITKSMDLGLDGQWNRNTGTILTFTFNDVEIEGTYAPTFYAAPPEILARLGGYYTKRRFRTDLDLKYQSDTDYMDDHLRVDARLAYSFNLSGNRTIELFAVGTNLTDRYHEEGGFEIPTTYSIGIEMGI